MEHFVITINGPWYEFFYNISFWLALVILIAEGIFRKFPLIKWILILVFIRMLFIIGSKIVHLPPHDFMSFIDGNKLPDIHQQSFLGALIFGGTGIIVSKYLFRFKHNISDSFAFVLPVALAIMRIGCFGAGCCHGKISNLPWAVSYPVNTLPHYHQFQENLISYTDFVSLPVHPVQLYEIAGLIAVILLLFKFRKTLRIQGNLLMLSVALIFIVRFITEFFRDIQAHTFLGEKIWFFTTTQIVILPSACILLYIIRKREHGFSKVKEGIATEESPMYTFFILLFLTFVFARFKSWFVLSEIIFIYAVLSFSSVILVIQIINQFSFSRYRWQYISMFILPFILMSQTMPVQKNDSTLTTKFKTIRIGFASGNFDNYYSIGRGEGCDRVSNTEYFKQKYYVAGAGIEFNRQQGNNQVNFGFNGIFGEQHETRISDNYESDNTIFDINPYASFETNWGGAGAGIHAGKLAFIYENKNEDGSGFPESGTKLVNFYPQFYLRVGPRRWFYADYHFADNFPSALPGFKQQIGVGSGLGSRNGTNLRFGYSLNDFYYVSGYFPIKNKFVVQPVFLWGPSQILDPYSTTAKTNYQFSLGLGYRFDYKEEYTKKWK